MSAIQRRKGQSHQGLKNKDISEWNNLISMESGQMCILHFLCKAFESVQLVEVCQMFLHYWIMATYITKVDL